MAKNYINSNDHIFYYIKNGKGIELSYSLREKFQNKLIFDIDRLSIYGMTYEFGYSLVRSVDLSQSNIYDNLNISLNVTDNKLKVNSSVSINEFTYDLTTTGDSYDELKPIFEIGSSVTLTGLYCSFYGSNTITSLTVTHDSNYIYYNNDLKLNPTDVYDNKYNTFTTYTGSLETLYNLNVNFEDDHHNISTKTIPLEFKNHIFICESSMSSFLTLNDFITNADTTIKYDKLRSNLEDVNLTLSNSKNNSYVFICIPSRLSNELENVPSSVHSPSYIFGFIADSLTEFYNIGTYSYTNGASFVENYNVYKSSSIKNIYHTLRFK